MVRELQDDIWILLSYLSVRREIENQVESYDKENNITHVPKEDETDSSWCSILLALFTPLPFKVPALI